jgi:hypothetical protein
MSANRDNTQHSLGTSVQEMGNTPKISVNTNTLSKNVNTVDANEKHTIASVESDVVRVWKRCMVAEERTRLLEDLLMEGLGTNEIEDFMDKQDNKKRGRGKGKRDSEVIEQQMKGKWDDCVQWERKMRRERGRLRGKLEKILGSKSTRYRKFVNRTRDKIAKERLEIRRKNEEKVFHLRNSDTSQHFRKRVCKWTVHSAHMPYL